MGKTKTKSRSVGDSPKPPITIRSTNPKILDDNIAKLEKAIQAGDVSANPSGTAEETLLSTIGIDGKKYELGPSAENTSYDNTDSGLTATDTQAAIDEVAPALTAEGTSYDNTDSGLIATDTQAAIDELATSVAGKSKITYTDVKTTSDANGYVELLAAPIDKTIAVYSLSQRQCVQLWRNYTSDTAWYGYVTERKTGTAITSTEIDLRIWKIE